MVSPHFWCWYSAACCCTENVNPFLNGIELWRKRVTKEEGDTVEKRLASDSQLSTFWPFLSHLTTIFFHSTTILSHSTTIYILLTICTSQKSPQKSKYEAPKMHCYFQIVNLFTIVVVEKFTEVITVMTVIFSSVDANNWSSSLLWKICRDWVFACAIFAQQCLISHSYIYYTYIIVLCSNAC